MEDIKKTFILLVFLGVALSAIFFLQGKNSSLGNSAKTYTVTLSEKGFSPDPISIRRGDSIKFVTQRERLFWPASDLHPTHDIYPGFDPKQPIEPTASWIFKFERLGTWGYHDHLAPFYTGTIKVQ